MGVASLVLWACAGYAAVHTILSLRPVLRSVMRKLLGGGQGAPTKRFGAWAVVTGSTDGIGRAIAAGMAKMGFNVLLIARNADKLAETKKQIESLDDRSSSSSSKVETLVVDFADRNLSYEKTIKSKLDSLDGDIGVLVNNVGLSYPSAQYFTEISGEFVDDLINVNVRSAMQMTHLVLPGMTERKRGAILCVGSGASQLPAEPLYAAYAGAKAAVEGFCRSLQVECVRSNVLVQCHTPLLVTSKLSKIRTHSLTVPTAERCASDIISEMVNGKISDLPTVSPYYIHALMLACVNLVPRTAFNAIRFKMVAAIRRRYMAKLSKAAGVKTPVAESAKSK